MSGAGKSTVVAQLVNEFGYQAAHPGAVCREITSRLFGTDDKTSLNKVNDALRSVDPNVWLRVALRDCDPQIPIVIDGIRFKSNLDFLRGENFSFWRISCPADLRRGRLAARGQSFDWAVDARHAGETELCGYAFDVEIDNGSTAADLADKVRRTLSPRPC